MYGEGMKSATKIFFMYAILVILMIYSVNMIFQIAWLSAFTNANLPKLRFLFYTHTGVLFLEVISLATLFFKNKRK